MNSNTPDIDPDNQNPAIAPTVASAARTLRVTPRTLRNWRNQGASGFLDDGRVDVFQVSEWARRTWKSKAPLGTVPSAPPPTITDPLAGAAVVVDLVRKIGPLAIALATATSETMTAALCSDAPGGLVDVVGAEFVEVLLNAAEGLERLVALAPAADKAIRGAGVETDALAWIAALSSNAGVAAMLTRRSKAYQKFSDAIPAEKGVVR